MKSKKIATIMLMVMVIMLLASSFAFAADDPGVAFGNWIQRNTAGVFIGILAIVGVVLLLKRQLMVAVVVITFAGLAAVFIYAGSEFAQKIGDIIKGFFL